MAGIDTEWRFLRGWSQQEIDDRLAKLSSRKLNFDSLHSNHMEKQFSEEVVAVERPGKPEEAGPFKRIKQAMIEYKFSDPGIVQGYFDPSAPLLGRRMLLELKSNGLSYLCGTVVSEILDEQSETETAFGYRYDTLQGHIESGSEWFILRKNHASGEIRFKIEAKWKPGRFPNWWTQAGFFLLARHYQRIWRRRAGERLAAIGSKKPASQLRAAMIAGAATGMRSFSALSRLAHRRHYRFERVLVGLAVMEMIADKLPIIPNRTDPAPALGRAVIGALTAALITRNRKLAPVGAATAVISTFAAFHLRKALTRQMGNRDTLSALAEDLLVLRARAAL